MSAIPLRVLIVEDSPDDVTLLVRILRKGGFEPSFERVQTEDAMRSALLEKPWDLVLADYRMPNFDGLRAIAVLNESGLDIPLIIVSGTIGEEIAVAAMKAGASDYVMKGNLQRLIPAIERELKEAVSREEKKKAERELLGSAEKYRNLVESISDVIFEIDVRGSLTYISPVVRNVLGYEAEDLVGKMFLGFVHPEDRYLLMKRFSELTKGVEYPLEYRIVGKSGEVRYVRTHARPIMKENNFEGASGTLIDITDRKLAEENLRESEDRHRSLVEHLPQRIFLKDRNSVYLSCNKNYASDLGITPEQIEGKDDFAFHSPERAEAYRADDQACMTTGMVKDIEETAQYAGQKRWLHTVKVPYHDRQGQVVGVLGIFEDITERKQAERRQYLASEILGILNDTSVLTDSIKLILDVIKRETDVDAVGIRLRSGDDFPYFVQSGFSQDFLLTENTLIAQDANGPCRDENGNIILECACGLVLSGQTDATSSFFTEGGSIWTNDSRLFLDIPADQDPRFHPRNNCIHQGFLSVALIPIRANGEIVGLLQLNDRKKDCFTLEMIRFFEGISASIGVAVLSKRAEEDLRISEDKFSKAFHMNPDAILITRLVDGMIVMVNEGFRQIFGATAEEVIGKTALELNIWVNPEDRNRVIEGVKTDGKVNNFEFIFRTRDGDIRYGLMSASIITLDGVAHILSITRDITERRLAQEQLFQAQKMEAVGTLAGGFAHDLNNKLQVIKGYVDLILFNKDVPETAKSNLGVIKHAVDTSAELIQGMMTFSRKTPVELQPIELNKLIASICSMLAHVIPKTIDIDLVAGDDLWTVNAAPNLIDQILMNLAINASDAMPDGGKLTIKTQNTTLDEEYCSFDPVAKPGRYVLIEVSDTGTGMDKETVGHIFEPFFTTKNLVKEQDWGSLWYTG